MTKVPTDYSFLGGSDAARAHKAEKAEQVEAQLVSFLIGRVCAANGQPVPRVADRPRTFADLHQSYSLFGGFALCASVAPLRMSRFSDLLRLVMPKSQPFDRLMRQAENYPDADPAVLLHFAYDQKWRVLYAKDAEGLLLRDAGGVLMQIHSKHTNKPYVLEEYDSFIDRRADTVTW